MLASPVHILRYGPELRAEMLYKLSPFVRNPESLVRKFFESLENKMSSGSFASLNEAELEQITDSRLSTKNATKYAVKTFRLLSQISPLSILITCTQLQHKHTPPK